MKIEQFYDEALAHASYAIVSNGEMALVDPARNPQIYYDFAKKENAKIKYVLETHPHADFVSSHLEIHETTGADIYISPLVGADYPHKAFEDGDSLPLGEVKIKGHLTPGHSPDSLSYLVEEADGTQHAVFSGDTLFIGDAGRPDLRESAGNIQAKREALAKDMYESTRNFYMKLDEEVMLYPAHGAGSLCGKNLSDDLSSTMGKQFKENYALQDMSKEEFVKALTEDQPYIPKYFGYNVDLNKQGAPAFQKSVDAVERLAEGSQLEAGITIIDTRPQEDFKKGHIKGAINIMDGGKFETWLGSLVNPNEAYYLIAADEQSRETLIERAAKIGYELFMKGAVVAPAGMNESSEALDVDGFKEAKGDFTIVDIRSENEAKQPIFEGAVNLPLHELRERASELKADKPVVVHCAGGYRSAAGYSIIQSELPEAKVYDLSEAVKSFE